MTRMPLRDWVQERLDNCVGIALGKTDLEDRVSFRVCAVSCGARNSRSYLGKALATG